ncbi:hypothetical protein SB758_38705, partial [Burkholderia sp. SIMBA_013]
MVNDPGTAIAALFGGWARPALIVIVLGVLVFNVLSLYSAYMSSVTIFSGFRSMTRIRRSTKFGVLFLLFAVSTWIAIAT